MNDMANVKEANVKEEEITLSEGFMKTMADILERCMLGKTNGTTISFEVNGKVLEIDMTFRIKPSELG